MLKGWPYTILNLSRRKFKCLSFRFKEKEKDLSQIDLNEDRRARRRMSSAEYLDGSLSEVVTSPETTSVQNRLLDIVGRNLSALLALSPGDHSFVIGLVKDA